MVLRADVVPVSALDADTRARLFAIHARTYAAVSEEAFAQDLDAKDWVVLMRDGGGAPRGFSTLRVLSVPFEGAMVRFVYSGDTVIERDHWGSQTLPLTWIEFAGRIASAAPDTALFWLLTTKGERTYRYLAAFARRFHPDWRVPMPPRIEALRRLVGEEAFGAQFDRGAGIVRRADAGGALRPEYRTPATRLRRPDVAFFEASNPGHGHGDELVCLCELSSANLRPRARARFEAGLAEGPPDTTNAERCP